MNKMIAKEGCGWWRTKGVVFEEKQCFELSKNSQEGFYKDLVLKGYEFQRCEMHVDGEPSRAAQLLMYLCASIKVGIFPDPAYEYQG